jgi:threonine synthase
MSYVVTLRCVSCGKEFDPRKIVYNCDRCGEILEVIYGYEQIKEVVTRKGIESRHNILPLRYRELLPIFDEEKIASLGEGGTPLVQCRRLGMELGLTSIYVKDETRNPTGVFKDRATVLATNKALEHGRKVVAIASTGNAAASMAGYAAKAGLQCNIFVPEVTPIGKVSQSIAYGAKIVQVKGNYDVAFDLTVDACKALGWYNCNPAINPFRIEGKKTIAYELCEQFNWEPPDWVVVPIGNGCDLAGNWKGFKEFYELGLISRKPRMVGIQPEGSNPLVSAFKEKREVLQPVTPKTIVGALAVGKPRNFIKAMRSLKESNGITESVTDEEILRAQSLLARTEGIFAEPGGATPLAGLIRLLQSGVISTKDRICVVATGHGLKDPEAPLKLAGKPPLIEPTVEAVKAAVPSR